MTNVTAQKSKPSTRGLDFRRWLKRSIRRVLILPLRPFVSEVYFLQRSLDRTQSRFDRLIERAPDKKTRDDLRSELHFETDELRDEIEHALTRQAYRQAYRFDVPVPEKRPGQEEDESWEPCWIEQNRYHLKPEARYRIRSLVRQERKERRELWIAWLPVISALTGLVGTLTGLIAFIKK